MKREDENLQVSRGGVQHIVVQYSTVQYITVQVSAVQYSAVQYREAFEEAGDVKREDEDLHGSRGGVQYIVVQCSTVQYSTVQYRLVQYSTGIIKMMVSGRDKMKVLILRHRLG